MVAPALHSSARMDWGTPRALYEAACSRWGSACRLDVAASAENALCSDFYDAASDGLAKRWRSVSWCNPPYGRDVGRWVDKAISENRDGVRSILLLAARTDTRWWHRAMHEAHEICFLRGRVRFVGAQAPAPFPSALILFGGRGAGPRLPGLCRFSGMVVPP